MEESREYALNSRLSGLPINAVRAEIGLNQTFPSRQCIKTAWFPHGLKKGGSCVGVVANRCHKLQIKADVEPGRRRWNAGPRSGARAVE